MKKRLRYNVYAKSNQPTNTQIEIENREWIIEI